MLVICPIPCTFQTIQAHQGAVAAACFSDDGKFLASYSPVDAKVHFWQVKCFRW